MENNQDNQNNRLFKAYGCIAFLFLLLMAGVPPISDHSWEWKRFQKRYYKKLIEKERTDAEKTLAVKMKREDIILRNLHKIDVCVKCHVLPKKTDPADESAENIQTRKIPPLEIKQIIVDEGRVDRCTTCHLGVDNPDFINEEQPYTTHPNYDQHPFEKFGCTICHAGQGRATSKDDAHGHVPFWEAPLIPLEYIQSSCGKCHFSQDIPGAPDLSVGRRIYKEKGCKKCHKLNGKGGSRGPELTTEGRFGHRDPNWLFKHFKDPKAVVPDTVMPNFNFTDEEAKSLTMYMLSLTDEKITGYLFSKKIIPDVNTGKMLFREKGCIGCHSIKGEGGKVGPDLTHVSKRRSANWIFKHFKDPKKVSPGTVMPKFGFTDDEAMALTMFVLSLSDEDVVGYIKKP